MSSLTERLRIPASILLRLANSLQPIAALLTRLVVGWAFIGRGKWEHFENTTKFFTDIGIPAPAANAAFIASLELVGGAMLMVGFGTRIFAALLSATMIVALMTADRQSLIDALHGSDKGLLGVDPLLPLLCFGWLVAFGAGAISIDRIIGSKGSKAS